MTVRVAATRRHGRVPLVLKASSPGSLATGEVIQTILVRGPSGSLDTGFATDGIFALGQGSEATGIVVDSAGKALLAAASEPTPPSCVSATTALSAADSTIGGIGALAIWRVLADGTTDTSFATPLGYATTTIASSLHSTPRRVRAA